MDEFTIATLKERFTLEEALDSDLDMIPFLSDLQDTGDFRQKLDLCRSQIEDVIQRHLGIPKSGFVLSQPLEWIRGSFNICLPIDINGDYCKKLPRTVLIRFPLPASVGENFSPGIIDEKLRCEAATYIWLQKNCPTIPIPRLYGMGFPGTQSFTAIENESFWNRIVWQLRRCLVWLQGDTLSPYFAHHRNTLTDTGYLLLEWVEEGQMLSSSWLEHHHDERRQANLYRGLAKIMLSLAKVPLPRIGSWTISDNGVLSLTNRPLTDLALFWNRHKIPTGIPRGSTYTSTEPFVHDMITYQDNRMRHQLNSILCKDDGIYQLSALVGLRALLPQIWGQSSRCGPFILTLPDLHKSNMFVDDEWNITRLIDFEFAPVCPVQMACVPNWLTGRGMDQLNGPYLEEYKILYDKFVNVVEEEENACLLDNAHSRRLRENWSTGRHWYTMALGSLNAFPAIFEQHLRPKFFEDFKLETDGTALTQLWDENVWAFIDEKLKDMGQYEEQVRNIFAKAKAQEMEKRDAGKEDGEVNDSLEEETQALAQLGTQRKEYVQEMQGNSETENKDVANEGEETVDAAGKEAQLDMQRKEDVQDSELLCKQEKSKDEVNTGEEE